MRYAPLLLFCECGQPAANISEAGLTPDHCLMFRWRCCECEKPVYIFKALSDCWRECPSGDETLLAAVSDSGSETRAEDLLFPSRMGISDLDDRESWRVPEGKKASDLSHVLPIAPAPSTGDSWRTVNQRMSPSSLQSAQMLDEGVKRTLQGTVEWLQKESDAESWWQAQIDQSEMCLSEMERMTDPRSQSKVAADVMPVIRAIPQVREMLSAMRDRDRATALEHGKAALAAM
jgi:hypothetical protein